MILTTHILSGALVGAEIKNPYAVAGLAVGLHFVLDILPHGDYLDKKSGWREFWKVALDLAIGLGLIAALFFRRGETPFDFLYLRNIWIGIFFSLLPDGTTLLYWKMGMKFLKPIYVFHQKLHRASDFSPERKFSFRNNPWDILISLASIFALIIAR
ncbi:MAG TPA: hypothetical protein VK254_04540 [Candidatus Bathyarchaeia archaeon]|nr:hypothetical protein [Candidatus Bathyarchaeia archaeon]